jgi:hypothetical protein
MVHKVRKVFRVLLVLPAQQELQALTEQQALPAQQVRKVLPALPDRLA